MCRSGGLAGSSGRRRALRRGAVEQLVAGALLIALLPAASRAQAPAFLVKDVNSEPEIFSSFPRELTTIGSGVFFVATTPGALQGLWRSDGTGGGTILLKSFTAVSNLTRVADTLFFIVGDSVTGTDLWKSDGTPAGTLLVKELARGPGTGVVALAAGAGMLFFTAVDGTHGEALWRSDGTEAGTSIVKEVRAIPPLTNVGGVLFFLGEDAIAGRELRRSDGTRDGTRLVKDINPGPAGSEPRELTDLNGMLFFVASDGTLDPETGTPAPILWTSDGTEAGTVSVRNGEPDDSAFFAG
jgi:ELWxxDGT repeat protein